MGSSPPEMEGRWTGSGCGVVVAFGVVWVLVLVTGLKLVIDLEMMVI